MSYCRMKSFFVVWAAVAILGIGLAGCGSSGGDAPVVTKTCEELNGMAIPAGVMELPTTGGVITATSIVVVTGSGASAVPEYCRVLGDINPVDPTAPKIKFQINLPTNWNKKAMMFGGGGFNGSIPGTAGQISHGGGLTPLQRGYATFGSDSGHQAGALGSQDHSFGLNEEAELNFAATWALKKTRDAAIYILKSRYGAAPTKSYFAGGSTGGREAFAAIQRWPADWDGAISWYPAWNNMGALLQGQRVSRAFAAPGAYPNQAKKKLLYDAAMAVCDTLDGVADGLISNQLACNRTFDVMTLRCPGGADTGNTCLSDAQINALNVLSTPANFNFYMASGLYSYPGCNVWGADLGRNAADAGNYSLQATVIFLALGNTQPTWPAVGPNWGTLTFQPYITPFIEGFFRYAIIRDAAGTVNTLNIDPENPGPYAQRISYLSAFYDTPTDISAFKAKGGKLLLAHGLVDVLVPSRATEMLYAKLQAQFGTSLTDFVRYYEIPGQGHAVTAAFTPVWDSLTTLENWVENKTAPVNLVMTDAGINAGRTRPMCDYPTWPKYKGSGDANLASSFTCATY